ncbi:MAG: transcription elongation factor GreA [Chloroflexi bacterium]|nr:transcription elongation factor GreA [Chloroflexota bacterium]MBS59705.1 transcription elongation factor GreA [Anaerolineaceae bacterium]HCU79794.1 transcription elongation factor GreA [Chloroflexota bacterium]|tara:strand:+ start:232 stop:699 length:468 start_codon:yes stop_codon:yes gene_type:complete
MKTNKTYLTDAGIQKLNAELTDLTTKQRPDLAKRLRDAIKMGDLSENADYIAAKEDQAFIEGRILEIQEMLRSSVLISDQTSKQEVAIGSTVTISEADGIEEKYTLVGPAEADPTVGMISHESPIGQAIIGKSVGDTVEVVTPSGTSTFKLIKLE